VWENLRGRSSQRREHNYQAEKEGEIRGGITRFDNAQCRIQQRKCQQGYKADCPRILKSNKNKNTKKMPIQLKQEWNIRSIEQKGKNPTQPKETPVRK